MMASGLEGELFKSKTDQCGICGKRVMANLVLCTICGNWVHGRCAKIKSYRSVDNAILFARNVNK